MPNTPTLRKEEFEAKVHEFALSLLRPMYEKCTADQQDLFCRMYKSVEDVPYDKLPWAYIQCARAVASNERKAVEKTKEETDG